jgi:hypothetical protein
VRVVLCCMVALLAVPAAAEAQAVAGDYGGGAISDASKPLNVAAGSSWMWARVGADGSARIGGFADPGCGLAQFDAEVRPAADGSFRFSRVRKVTTPDGHRLRSIVTVRGRFAGAAASGTVRARLRNRYPGGRVRRCTMGGGRRFELRMRAPAGAPAAPSAGATYYGLTSEQSVAPRPFLLRVHGSGRRVLLSVFEYTRVCQTGRYFLNDVTPSARISPDGSFAIRERFTLRYRRPRENERFRVSVDGRFVDGGVTGTLRVQTVVRRPGRRAVRDRCDTGALGFDARL